MYIYSPRFPSQSISANAQILAKVACGNRDWSIIFLAWGPLKYPLLALSVVLNNWVNFNLDAWGTAHSAGKDGIDITPEPSAGGLSIEAGKGVEVTGAITLGGLDIWGITEDGIDPNPSNKFWDPPISGCILLIIAGDVCASETLFCNNDWVTIGCAAGISGWTEVNKGWLTAIMGCVGWIKGWADGINGWPTFDIGWTGGKIGGQFESNGWLVCINGWADGIKGWFNGIIGWVFCTNGWTPGIKGWALGIRGWLPGINGWLIGGGNIGWDCGITGAADNGVVCCGIIGFAGCAVGGVIGFIGGDVIPDPEINV